MGVALVVMLHAGVAIGAAPQDDEARAAAASARWSEGYKLFHKQRFDQALFRFEEANALLPGKAEIVYYLGRTHAALGQCAEALKILVPLAGTLGESEAAQEAERLRGADEASCRVRLARERMAAFACIDAVAVLATLRIEMLDRDAQPGAVELVSAASRCATDFDTNTEAGRAAARAHADARRHLAEGRPIDALRAADESLAKLASDPAKLVRALALEQLGRCDDALVTLENAKRSINSTVQAEQSGVIDRCRVSEAKRFVAAEDCRSAIPLLEKLQGRVNDGAQQWLDETLAWCAARMTVFLTNTPDRRAAYAHFEAARKAAAAGKLDVAKGRYTKALGLADEPIIRRELAHVFLRLRDCPQAQASLAGIAEPQRSPRDLATLQACGPFKPERALEGDGLVGYVDALEQAWSRLDAKDFEAARKLLGALYVVGSNPAVRAASLDVLFQMDRCAQYAAETAEAPRAVRDLMADLDRRQAVCGAAPTVVAVKPVASAAPIARAESAEFGLQASTPPRTARRGARIAGWMTLTLGVAALGLGGYAMAKTNAAANRASDAASVYNAAASAPEAFDARDAYDRSADDRDTWRTRAVIFGTAGGAAALTGIILLIVGRDRGTTDSAQIKPYTTARSVGLAGSF